MSAKLCQIIAIEKGSKNATGKVLTDCYQKMQKGQLLMGISRTYKPKDDEGDKLPSESTQVQLTVDDVIKSVIESEARLFDVTATKDVTNCAAAADVIVDGIVLMKGAPVTYLLFLEKKLVDLHTLISKLPVLDPSEKWSFNENTNCYASEAAESTRTKKVLKNHVKAAASERHPAQVDVFTEDEIVGYWTTVKFSGAIPVRRQKMMFDRVEKLQRAVKFAREEANSMTVTDVKVGDTILGFIFSEPR